MQPIDYISPLGRFADAGQLMQAMQLGDAQIETERAQQEAYRAQVGTHLSQQQEAASKAARAQAYQADLIGVLQNPTAQKYSALLTKYPEFNDALKTAWNQLDTDQQRVDLGQIADIYSLARRGDYAGASKLLKTRIEADENAGQDVEADKMLLAELESGDPDRQRAAIGSVGLQLAAISGPEHMAALHNAVKPDLRSVTPGATVIDEATGGVVYTSPYRPELVTRTNADGSTDTIEYVPSSPEGGDQGGGGRGLVANAKSAIEGLFPGVRVTDWKRDPNSKLGRANPGSYHNSTGAAVDVAPIPGLKFKDFIGSIRQAGFKIIEARDEATNPLKHTTGPNWHVVLGGEKATQSSGNRVVSSTPAKPVIPSETRVVGGQVFVKIAGQWMRRKQ